MPRSRAARRLSSRVRGIDPAALHVLVNHGWKGNVRELENLIERAMILGDGELIQLRHLSRDVAGVPPSNPVSLKEAVRLFERQYILDVLAQVRFDKRDAARLLGISLASLYRKLNMEPSEDTGAHTA